MIGGGMNNMQDIKSLSPSWSFDEILHEGAGTSRIHDNEHILYILVAASFVEMASHKYACNLCCYFQDDQEVCGWLENNWEPEEINHGRAIRSYVEHVWPDFDWQRAYADFLEEYSQLCTLDELESPRALEMAARCVVEMGTSTYYGAIREFVDDPALKRIATLIRADEVRHYKHFYRFFLKYNAVEGNGRMQVLGALCRRLWEIRSSDANCAVWHVFKVIHPGQPRNGSAFHREIGLIAEIIRRNYPTTTAIKMFLKPLHLPPLVQRVILPPVSQAARHLFMQ
jgi:hypothetical protein